MINKKSIATAYDEHLTLVEWLQEVEKALKDASAVSFNVNKRGNATLTFSVVFEDGSELETDPIILEQGESVHGATIRNGHLILTLTNGDELDAGDLGGVSGFTIDASQHLIVTYQNGTTQDLGAIFNGNVNINGNFTANSIIENMSGYSIQLSSSVPQQIDLTPIYFGACKNGNKLTLVMFFNIKRTASISDQTNTLLNIKIPTEIGEKIFTYSLDDFNNVVCMGISQAVSDIAQANNAPFKYYFRKNSNTELVVHNRNLTELVQDTTYLVRIEQTFLLSDNLAE